MRPSLFQRLWHRSDPILRFLFDRGPPRAYWKKRDSSTFPIPVRRCRAVIARRLFHVLIMFTILTLLIAGRLFWLQARPMPHRTAADASALSVRQRSQGVTVDTGRGDMVDRRGRPLTGRSVSGLLLLPGGAALAGEARSRALAEALGASPERLLAAWRSADRPMWWNAGGVADTPQPLSRKQEARIRAIAVPGAAVVARRERNADSPLAHHLLGFVAEQPDRTAALYADRIREGRMTPDTPIGAAGLELAFDRWLLGAGASRVVSYADGTGGRRLEGLGLRSTGGGNPFYPLQLVTTIDAELQRAVEDAADRAGLDRGAVVVLDVRNSDILAMASRPVYDAGARFAGWDDRTNRALDSVAPGSVMKSFIAAAALEEGVVTPHETFLCEGVYGRYGLTCWKEGGHGRLTFEEALAKSCNVVFAEVGERLSGPTLQRYGEALGLIGPVGWRGVSAVDGSRIRQLPEEQPGRLFAGAPEAADGGALAQTAIGQRDAAMSPLAAANWMVTLLQGGRVHSPRAASSLRSADGIALERYEPHRLAGARVPLSATTVFAVRRMLERVAAEGGTGASLRHARWPLAGKSGTAETVAGGREAVHQWFVGYGPADRPRYAVAVLAQARPPGSPNAATTVFRAVMDALAGAEAAER